MAGSLPDNTVTLLEPLDITAHLHDLTCDVSAEDDGPILDHEAVVLDLPYNPLVNSLL